VSSLESKRFRFIWNSSVSTRSDWTSNTVRGTLRNLEEAWQVYAKILGYREPAYPIGSNSGTAYKLNIISYHSGYWAGVDDHGGMALGYLNITPDGLRVSPPSWIIPHELMHAFQFHNASGHIHGEWYETHANYGRERWIQHYQDFYPNGSNIEALGVRDGHFMMSSGRNYYLTWPFMYYVDTNPDNLSDIGEGTIKRVWQETQPGEFAMMALDRITPTTSLKDLSGYYARRCATWDFSNQSAMTAELNLQDPIRNARHLFTDLLQRPDAPGWWRVPSHKAPAQGAYAMHELVPNGSGAGRVVTVNLQGLADSARGADWRASLIAVSDGGVERYTPLWSHGVQSITLAADENRVFLSVAGTPDVYHYGGHDEASFRFRSHPSRSRFHYQVQITGATPRVRNNGSTVGMTQHVNGGGWRSVSVPNTVFIGPNARVTGGSVSGNARIEDFAVVSGGTVQGNAIISGNAWVRGGTVTNEARVRDWAIVDGGTISGNARVLEHATVEADMQGNAVAKGSALHQVGGTLSGNAIVDGDYMGNKSLSGGVTFGHLPFVGIPDNFTTTTPTGLYAAYDFRQAHDSRVLDQYGVVDAFPQGTPRWTFTDGRRKGFLQFDGSSQSILLDRSVADSRAWTFAAWVKPSGGLANQAVLWLGASSTRRLCLTPDDGAGLTKFSIARDGVEQTLSAASLPTGVWSHVAVSLDGSTGVLYVNGNEAARGPISLRPDQLLAENIPTAASHHYLARSEGSLMPMFAGSLDDVQFYTTALTSEQLHAVSVATSASSGTLLLSDDFNSPSFSAGEFNNSLSTDQRGFLAPTTYSVTTGGQGWQAQHGNGGSMLLVGDAGFASSASLNEDFSSMANSLRQPISLEFDATVSDTSNGDCWSSITIGSRQNIIAVSNGAKFGILPTLNGSIQVWVNGVMQPIVRRSSNSFRIILTDTDGLGSAFDGNGSKAILYNGGTLVGVYVLPQLVPGDGWISFSANPFNGSFNITRIDNLSISRVVTTHIWQGDTNTDFRTAANYLDDTWTEWANYQFDINTIQGNISVDAIHGWGNLSLLSGLRTDISIGGSAIIHMAPAMVDQWVAPSLGGRISIASDSKNLTIGNRMLVAGAMTWDVGTGRTLTVTGTVEDWVGLGAASLEKRGNGTVVLRGVNAYSGPTHVQGGMLHLGNGSNSANLADSADVHVAAGAILHLDYIGTDRIGGLTVDGRALPPGVYAAGSGFLSGTGSLTVTRGPDFADFATWSGRAFHQLTSGPLGDEDQDGMANILEYVLGGNPQAPSHHLWPSAREESGHMVFAFTRQTMAQADTTQIFQYSNNLQDWTDVPIVHGGMVEIQSNTPQAGTDTVIITVPAARARGIFGRLQVSSTAPP
jgi:autotransporter-associated beta strand protein